MLRILPGDLIARKNVFVGYVHLSDDAVIWHLSLGPHQESSVPRVSFVKALNLHLNEIEDVYLLHDSGRFEIYREGEKISP